MKIISTAQLSDRDFITHIEAYKNKNKNGISKHIRQKGCNRVVLREQGENKQKTNSTGELIDRRQANTSTNLTKGHTVLLFDEATY